MVTRSRQDPTNKPVAGATNLHLGKNRIADLTDVDVATTALAASDQLYWDAAKTKWVNKPPVNASMV